MAAGLSWCWSVVGAIYCVVVSWYLPERCSEGTKSGLERLSTALPKKSCLIVRLSEISSEESCLNEKKNLL